jgi:pyridoxine kinase
MARVLALSSHVAFGSVGLAVIVPALQALGHEVVALPTVILSNHPGYACFSGDKVAPATLERIIDALDANGWLAGIGGVLTGYLPTPGHVRAAEAAVRRIRAANASLLFVCDPVFGDDPGGLYLEEAAAAAVRERLLPLCDVATPNRFELEWLSGKPAASVEEAAAAARTLGVPSVLATSIPAGKERLATLLVGASEARACFVARREAAPHGTGDLLAGLYLGHALNGASPDACLGRAAAAVEASIAASSGRAELSLAGVAWARAEPLPTRAI